MPMILGDPLQTFARAYQEICAGDDPWVALGNFLNDWFVYEIKRRAELIAEQPAQLENPTLEQQRWSSFIAASTEYLCQQHDIRCPTWVYDDLYRLEMPWYDAVVVTKNVQIWLEETTPEPFRRRNIYCGDRLYLDKEEVITRSA
ncbi:MAG: hypothetical protein ACRDHW_01600 [Ktedonobacteraceae bacterium]